MTETSMVGRRLENTLIVVGVTILTQAEGRIVLKLSVGCGMKNRKSQATDLTCGDWDKHFEWSGM